MAVSWPTRPSPGSATISSASGEAIEQGRDEKRHKTQGGSRPRCTGTSNDGAILAQPDAIDADPRGDEAGGDHGRRRRPTPGCVLLLIAATSGLRK